MGINGKAGIPKNKKGCTIEKEFKLVTGSGAQTHHPKIMSLLHVHVL